jgi:hypothetical protein
VGVKVVIERDANPRLPPRDLQNLDILGALQAHLGHVHRVEAFLAEEPSGVRSQSLVEEKAVHATRSMLRLSSSTAAAA